MMFVVCESVRVCVRAVVCMQGTLYKRADRSGEQDRKAR